MTWRSGTAHRAPHSPGDAAPRASDGGRWLRPAQVRHLALGAVLGLRAAGGRVQADDGPGSGVAAPGRDGKSMQPACSEHMGDGSMGGAPMVRLGTKWHHRHGRRPGGTTPHAHTAVTTHPHTHPCIRPPGPSPRARGACPSVPSLHTLSMGGGHHRHCGVCRGFSPTIRPPGPSPRARGACPLVPALHTLTHAAQQRAGAVARALHDGPCSPTHPRTHPCAWRMPRGHRTGTSSPT